MYSKWQAIVDRTLQLLSIVIFCVCHTHHAYSSCAHFLGDVVIVGPYSSGVELAPVVRAMGYRPIAVIPEKPPYNLTARLSDFDKVLVANRPLEDILDQVVDSPFRARAVIPGSEWDPAYADTIRHGLRMRDFPSEGNSPRYARARQDKRFFYQLLDQKGVPTIKHFESNRLDQVIQWVRNHGKWPVVVKPPSNAGGTGVRFCYSEGEVEAAFRNILTGEKNDMLREDDVVSLQERNTDPEFAVNGVRSRGRTLVTGIWEYERREVEGASTIYVTDRLSGLWGPTQSALVSRTHQTLSAVEHDTGSFHLELFYSPERGALPNDLGARLSGGGLPSLEVLATDRDPFLMTAQSFLAPEALSSFSMTYRHKRNAAVVFISTLGNGARASYDLKGELEDLKTRGKIVDYHFNHPENSILKRTTDSDSVVAVIKITGDSREEVEEMVQQFTLWQKQRRFEK